MYDQKFCLKHFQQVLNALPFAISPFHLQNENQCFLYVRCPSAEVLRVFLLIFLNKQPRKRVVGYRANGNCFTGLKNNSHTYSKGGYVFDL